MCILHQVVYLCYWLALSLLLSQIPDIPLSQGKAPSPMVMATVWISSWLDVQCQSQIACCMSESPCTTVILYVKTICGYRLIVCPSSLSLWIKWISVCNDCINLHWQGIVHMVICDLAVQWLLSLGQGMQLWSQKRTGSVTKSGSVSYQVQSICSISCPTFQVCNVSLGCWSRCSTSFRVG